MKPATLEHINMTVTDPVKTAELLCSVFDWRIRWQGPAINGGLTVHVGSDDSYIAVYSSGPPKHQPADTYATKGGLNHVALVVDDLDAVEQKVLKAGCKTHSHADYEPGRRFYFHDHDGIEYEVVSY